MSEQVKSRIPYWLLISLIINALLIGFIIGGGFGKRQGGGDRGPMRGGSEQAIARALDASLADADRAALRQALRSSYRASRDERLALREARQKLAKALGADVYDIQAVREAFKDIRLADGEVKSDLQDELARQFEKLPAEQRKAIVASINKRDRRRGNRDRRGGPPGDRPPPPRD